MAEPLRVGFQGEAGAFSEGAVRILSPEAEPVPLPSFEAVVDGVAMGSVDGGVLPVENTLAGTVAAAFDALANRDVTVTAEVAIPIRHYLLGVPGASEKGLVEVRSHPVALAQCRSFFAARPGLRAQAVYDTAGAARDVAAAGDPSVAAIAPSGAAPRYGLEVLEQDLQDRDDNQTRFLLLDRESAVLPDSAPLKTAWVAELDNRPGALHALLGVFAGRGLDLTHVASRPAATPWTYRFILEFRHPELVQAETALEEARGLGARAHVLGTFVAWEPTPVADGEGPGP